MKNLITLLTIVISIALSGPAVAQNVINVSGIVLSSDNGMPVADHPVRIRLDTPHPHKMVFTGPDGTFSDSLFYMGMNVDSMFVATIDCNFEWQEQVFTNLNNPVYAEFYICTDSLPGGCEASFSWEASQQNHLQVSFTNLSSGNNLQWMWDFGDGTISSQENPVHIFPEAGEYMVCLGIQSMDSLFSCFDMVCDRVMVGDSVPGCTADFEYHLDSSAGSPNRFVFTSTSTGNIHDHYWDFGDGSSGTGAQIVHEYQDEGEYEVCLTINTSGYPPGCSDVTCKNVITPDYTYFGGQVFAGNFPLNNPISTGDTGIVYLYRLSGPELIPVDTQYFYNELGLYAFNMVLPGDYIIKSGLTRHSSNFTKYFQTYYPQSIRWQSAGILNLEGPIQNANIHLSPTRTDLPQGPGTIHGAISFMTQDLMLFDPANVEVILFDGKMDPLAFTLTDPTGHFTFQGLGMGHYKIMAEATGWNSTIEDAWITHTGPLVNLNTIFLEGSTAFGVNEEVSAPELFEGPWPVPALERLNLRMTVRDDILLIISDLTGRTVYREELTVTSQGEVLTVPVSNLRSGVYLLRVSSANGGATQVKKFIR